MQNERNVPPQLRTYEWHDNTRIMKEMLADKIGFHWHAGEVEVRSGTSLEDLQRASEYVAQYLTPLPVSEMIRELESMSVVMAVARAERGATMTARCQQIAQELSYAPADVFLRAMSKLKGEQTFFPSVKDFKDIVDDYAWSRFAIKKGLDKLVKKMQ